MSDSNLEPKRCPHCGCRLVDVIDFNESVHYVKCRLCQLQGPDYSTRIGAIYGWNKLPRNSMMKNILGEEE